MDASEIAIDKFAGRQWWLINHSYFPESQKAYTAPDYTYEGTNIKGLEFITHNLDPLLKFHLLFALY